MGIKGKKVVVLVEEGYQDLEVWYPYLRLKEEGAQVFSVAPEKKTYQGKNGYPIEVDAGIREIRANNFDAIVIPGGWAPDKLRRNKQVVELVKKLFYDGKVVSSICHGGSLLVSAGVLKGKTATSFDAIKDDMIYAGADWVDKEVVVDGNLVTSRKPSDLPAFCRETIRLLSK
ncbi:MAG: type 1 glutamine amidotransferase domain-containing protein [Candidatus Micrarchaeota archaeon]